MQFCYNRILTSIITGAVILCFRIPDTDAGQEQTTVQDMDGFGSAVVLPKDAKPNGTSITQTGIASWYGRRFAGRKTASGEIYNPNDRTAAHRTLAFGTYVRVTNLRNKKNVVVRINNRGPFIKGRVIDVSRKAAIDLGLDKSGIARVHLEVVSKELAVTELLAVE